ncbi:hypothetical protein QYE76_039892 [Lolium multiflorum]|uniref:F-box domain-containing protein n=1 Tax=Lolium multiflorum TaxID=4521 RepID=A0AAD8TAJ7_LOLMU|nr:hypothetical protein QYE76_039892 [Lolium multiflorum]
MSMHRYHHRVGGDRLSALPDSALVHVLSHLLSNEAARTSVLSRRWRRVFAEIPVINLVDGKIVHRGRKDMMPVCFDQQVTCAVLSKGQATAIRTFRLIVLDGWPVLLGQWLVIAATSGVEEVDVELRYFYTSSLKLCPFGTCDRASADFGDGVRNVYTKTPRRLFRCATLRRLRLVNWRLDLPSGLVASSIETLCLRRIQAPEGALQQLLSVCPRLVDLTLEECPSVTEITVSSDRLRSFSMICCHNATRVVLRSRRLRSLHYKGGLPLVGSLFDVPNYDEITAVTIDICEDLTSKAPEEIGPVTDLIRRCKKLTYLHLALRPSMAYYCSLFTAVVRELPELRQLVLKGFLAADHVVGSVAVMLINANNLEVLSLFPLDPEPSKKKNYYDSDSSNEEDVPYSNSDDEEDVPYSDSDDEEDGPVAYTRDYHPYTETENCIVLDNGADYDWMTMHLWRMNIPCLGGSLRRIDMTNYNGNAYDRILAQFLLSKAVALEKFSVTLASQVSPQKKETTSEFRSWRCNLSAIVTCTPSGSQNK